MVIAVEWNVDKIDASRFIVYLSDTVNDIQCSALFAGFTDEFSFTVRRIRGRFPAGLTECQRFALDCIITMYLQDRGFTVTR